MSCVYIEVRVEAQGHSNLAARETPHPEETVAALLVSVVGRWPYAKLLLVRSSHLFQPVRIRLHGEIDQLVVDAGRSQVGADSQGSVTPSRMKRHEIFHIAAVVDELFSAQPIDDLRRDARREALVDQFAPQLPRRAITPRQGVECRRTGGARVARVDSGASPGVTPP